MKNQNLYLVGTVHLDLDGRERLDTLLDRLSPSVVALEFHKDREDMMLLKKSFEEEQREIDTMIDNSSLNLNPRQRATLIESECKIKDIMGYEFKSSRDYVKRNSNSRLEYIDISLFANGKEEFVKGYEEMIRGIFNQVAENPEESQSWLKDLDDGIDVHDKSLRKNIQQIYQNVEMVEELFEMIRDPEIFEMIKEDESPQVVQILEQIYNPKRDKIMGTRVRELYDGKKKLVAIVGLGHLKGLKAEVRDLNPRTMTLAEYDSI